MLVDRELLVRNDKQRAALLKRARLNTQGLYRGSRRPQRARYRSQRPDESGALALGRERHDVDPDRTDRIGQELARLCARTKRVSA
jgi:hypothetical protein